MSKRLLEVRPSAASSELSQEPMAKAKAKEKPKAQLGAKTAKAKLAPKPKANSLGASETRDVLHPVGLEQVDEKNPTLGPYTSPPSL